MAIMTGLILAGLLTTGAPDMHVASRGLNLSRPGDAAILADRIRTASRDWCAEHRAILTPDQVGDPRVCETEMRRRASATLPMRQRVMFVRAGGQRALNRP